MDYSEHAMKEVVEKDRQFYEFFQNVKATLRLKDIKETEQKWTEKDYELQKQFREKQVQVHAALADNFDTPLAIKLLSQLITSTNSYMQLTDHQVK